MRFTKISAIAVPLTSLLALAACSKDQNTDGGGGGGTDASVDTDATTGADAGFPDADPPDTGPLPCLRDQGGVANRGCEPGFVCNLAMNPAQCVPGRACTTDTDCNACSTLPIQNATDCGHGFALVSICDDRHGNVCTRSRAPCEPCQEDRDCGRPHPVLPTVTPNKCLDYGGGEKFCGRACGSCPNGFTCDVVTSQCKRATCSAETAICPSDDMPMCSGTDQICPGEECPNTGGARCSTNDQPGALGICIGFCTQNSDCPANLPICNTRNGLCIAGCSKGGCAGSQVCHVDGFCRPPCADDAYCQMTYGADTYCNTPGRPAPQIFKSYRDRDSCAPLGCEEKIDCVSAGRVCDKTRPIPECVEGCYETEDCSSGFICKSTSGDPPRPQYSRQECRALAQKTNPNEIGVCCNPGCTDRILQCGINEFCCGEVGSPYEDPMTCLTVTSTGGPQAEPGECFQMGPDPWCNVCMSDGDCASGYTPGYNTDPAINMGNAFQEQEWCRTIAMGLAICNITCNPNNVDDNACPRGWNCRANAAPCFQDADCNGLECVGEDISDPDMNNWRPGRCKCGQGGVPATACPTAYTQLGSAAMYPRCVDIGNTGGDMVCVVSYNCEPPSLSVNMMTGDTNYPGLCEQRF